MRPIAFVTCTPFGPIQPNGFSADDALAVAVLESEGLTVQAVRWDDADADWLAYALIVIRSPWDYFRRLPEFLAWLNRLEALGAPVHNPIPVLRDNLDKAYLVRLQEQGVAVTPTVLIKRGLAPSLTALLAQRGWDEAVAKPAVSGAAFETWRVSRSSVERSQARFAELVCERDMLVQPYLTDIAEGGEWSLVFFHGEFSHALRKFPASGDFRVQQYHGGSLTEATAPPELIATATELLTHVPGPLLYARVDGVMTAEGFLLMELELIEPELFLRTHPAAPARFARAIQQTLTSAESRCDPEDA